jgi:hypothetical protein
MGQACSATAKPQQPHVPIRCQARERACSTAPALNHVHTILTRSTLTKELIQAILADIWLLTTSPPENCAGEQCDVCHSRCCALRRYSQLGAILCLPDRLFPCLSPTLTDHLLRNWPVLLFSGRGLDAPQCGRTNRQKVDRATARHTAQHHKTPLNHGQETQHLHTYLSACTFLSIFFLLCLLLPPPTLSLSPLLVSLSKCVLRPVRALPVDSQTVAKPPLSRFAARTRPGIMTGDLDWDMVLPGPRAEGLVSARTTSAF